MLFASFPNPLLFFGTHFLLFMSRNSLQMALFPGQAIYGARIIPTENSFGTPSLQQKKMLSNMRTSPNSLLPAIAFHSIQSVHLSARCCVTFLAHKCCPCLGAFCSSFKQKDGSSGSCSGSRGCLAFPADRLELLHLVFPLSDNAVLCSPLPCIHISNGNVSSEC